jgi:regulatory protein
MWLSGRPHSKSGPTVAQTWRVARLSSDRNRPPLDAAALERLALDYVGRYATSRAKLRGYLQRKLIGREWSGDKPPQLDAIVARLTASGFVDDQAFAAARAAGLARRGYGARRVGDALRAAGIDGDDAAPALEEAGSAAWQAAETYAKRRKIGPFAAEAGDRDARLKAFAAMARAGHPPEIARAFVMARPGNVPTPEE